MRKTLLLVLLLCSPVWAQTLVIQDHEVPYTLVDGRQLVKRADLGAVFPEMANQEGTVDVAILADHPDARVTKRDGLILRIKYYNAAQAAIYEGVRKEGPRTTGEPPASGSGVKVAVVGRSKTTSPVPDHDAHILSLTVTNNGDQPLSLNSRTIYVLDETGTQHPCETGQPIAAAPGATVRLDDLTFNVPKRNTITSVHVPGAGSANL